MSRIVVSAPGKAVIAGEYAVLFGATAVVAAIDRRAIVRIEEADDEYHHVSTPGLADDHWRFRAGPGGNIDWQDEIVGGRLDLFECIWRQCADESMPPISVEIDTRAFFDVSGGSKLGLGSSAATTVALAGALLAMRGNGQDLWQRASRSHHEFQAGRGSGVDVAASMFGGLLAYRVGDRSPPRRLAWPRGLYSRFLWSGTAADTREKLTRLGARHSEELANSAECVASTWESAIAAEIIHAMKGYVAALVQFSNALDLGIFDAGHAELLDLARRCNVVYKPCGAGGGDIGMVMAETIEEVEAYCSKAARFGFTTPALERDPRGMVILEEGHS